MRLEDAITTSDARSVSKACVHKSSVSTRKQDHMSYLFQSIRYKLGLLLRVQNKVILVQRLSCFAAGFFFFSRKTGRGYVFGILLQTIPNDCLKRFVNGCEVVGVRRSSHCANDSDF